MVQIGLSAGIVREAIFAQLLDSDTGILVLMALLAFGAVQAFFGYKIFKTVIKILGGITGFIIGFCLVGFPLDASSMPPAIGLTITLIAAGFLGWLFWRWANVFQRFAVFFANALLVGVVLFFMMGEEQWPFALVIAIAVGILSVIFQKISIILTTAFGGAGLIASVLEAFVMSDDGDMATGLALNLVTMILFGTIASIIQFRRHGVIYKAKNKTGASQETQATNVGEVVDETDKTQAIKAEVTEHVVTEKAISSEPVKQEIIVEEVEQEPIVEEIEVVEEIKEVKVEKKNPVMDKVNSKSFDQVVSSLVEAFSRFKDNKNVFYPTLGILALLLTFSLVNNGQEADDYERIDNGVDVYASEESANGSYGETSAYAEEESQETDQTNVGGNASITTDTHETEEIMKSDFIIHDSHTRVLDEYELEAYTLDEIHLIGEEILARHGKAYLEGDYKDYFESKSWYEANPNYDYNLLSDIEMENYQMIVSTESYYRRLAFEESLMKEFVFYDSDVRALEQDELDDLSLDELAYARNEIFARHGYSFKMKKFRDYFNEKSWYEAEENFDPSSMNDIENDNVMLIKREEERRKQ
jgi:hypothetical protein